MKILVTGADGQLGNELRDISGDYPGWTFYFTDVDSLDVTSESTVTDFIQKKKPDYIINCAAYTAVDKAETDRENARLLNAVAPGYLAKAAKKLGAKLIHISTDYVFSGNAFLPYSENDPVNPQGVYGLTKREGEVKCLQENPETIIIRTSWLYSSYGNNFVKTMVKLGREKEMLKVVFDQVGTPTYAADLAKAVLSVVQISKEKKDGIDYGIYHYSNEGVTSWYDFAMTIFELAGIHCQVIPVLSDEFPSPVKRPHYSVLNKSKIKSNFNLEIPYWKDSLRVCLKKLNKE